MGKAKEIRRTILQISASVKSAHIGSNLSCVDILDILYSKLIDLKDYEKRDIFILSKAHSALALYSALFHYGFLSKEELEGYYQDNGTLPAHTDRFTNRYVEISSGSLGHGLPIALGYALAVKGESRKVFCLMGDGESQEGSIWEAAMLAPKLKVGNLIVLVDFNNLQGYGRATELVEYEPIVDKWRSFGWECYRVDGHKGEAIYEVVSSHKDINKPLCIICDTIKGKGVSFMEDKMEWHYYAISNEELKEALKGLE